MKIQQMWDRLVVGLNAFLELKDSEIKNLQSELDLHKSVYSNYVCFLFKR